MSNPHNNFIFNVILTHPIKISSYTVFEIVCRQINGYDEEYLLQEMNFGVDNNSIFNISNKLIERCMIFYFKQGQSSPFDIENKSNEIVMNLSLGDKNKLLLLIRASILGDVLQLETRCSHCNERISKDLLISHILTCSDRYRQDDDDDGYHLTNNTFENDLHTDKGSIKIKPITVKDQADLIKYNNKRYDAKMSNITTDKKNSLSEKNSVAMVLDKQGSVEKAYKEIIANRIIDSNLTEIPLKYLLSEKVIAKINSKLSDIDPLSYIDLYLKCPYCEKIMKESFYTEYFILQEIFSYSKQLPLEINWIALNYNWTEDGILNLPLSKRKQYVDLITKSLSGELFL